MHTICACMYSGQDEQNGTSDGENGQYGSSSESSSVSHGTNKAVIHVHRLFLTHMHMCMHMCIMLALNMQPYSTTAASHCDLLS